MIGVRECRGDLTDVSGVPRSKRKENLSHGLAGRREMARAGVGGTASRLAPKEPIGVEGRSATAPHICQEPPRVAMLTNTEWLEIFCGVVCPGPETQAFASPDRSGIPART